LSRRPDDLHEKIQKGLADGLATGDADDRAAARRHAGFKGQTRQKVIALDPGFREGVGGGKRRLDGIELVGLDVEEIDLAGEGLVESRLGA
jgi:hypothetical protein